ncbi:DUF362 domain-containing protein [bacterium]|nr:DUF362 domain-containing protein [bacterium]
MKRREFITTTAATAAALAIPRHTYARAPRLAADALDLHPFIEANPQAVFIKRTSVPDKLATDAKRAAGRELASEIFSAAEGGDIPFSSAFAIKPNLTCTNGTGNTAAGMGIITDLDFLDGVVDGVTTLGFPGGNMFAREGNWLGDGYCAGEYNVTGVLVEQLSQRYGMHVHDFPTGRNLRDMTLETLQEGTEVIWKNVPDGQVFQRLGYVAPYNDEDSWLLNIAKFKTHGMGMTLCAKNLQGMVVSPYVRFCEGVDATKQHPSSVLSDFHPDFEQHIDALYSQHLAAGIPRWDRPGRTASGGYGMETWAQRTCDSQSVIHPGLNIIEGIYGRNGDGFNAGPGPGDTPQDFMSNILVFGKNPFHVDIVGIWLAGHEPGNFGLYHIAHERGLSPLFNPASIPLYDWNGGEPIQASLNEYERTPLRCPYLTRDYDGGTEEHYHLVDEPFDYSTVGAASAASLPEQASLMALTNPVRTSASFQLSLPRETAVRVDVYNQLGQRVGRLSEGRMQAGTHHLRWSPGRLPSGMYIVVLHARNQSAQCRVMLTR